MQSRRHHLAPCPRHVHRHGAPCTRRVLGSRRKPGSRDSTSASVIVPPGPLGFNPRKVDAERARACPHRGRGAIRRSRGGRGADCWRRCGRCRGRELADHGAALGMRAFFEFEQRRANLHALARAGREAWQRAPTVGEGISTTAFSVSTDTNGWSTTTWSPSATCQRRSRPPAGLRRDRVG